MAQTQNQYLNKIREGLNKEELDKFNKGLSALRENTPPEDDRPVEELSFEERQRRKLEEKRSREEEERKREREKASEEKKRREKEKQVVLFNYYVDFGSIIVIGLVFFLTCLTGLLYGVSQKGISVRAIISAAIASVVVCISRRIVKKYFHPEREENKDEKDDK